MLLSTPLQIKTQLELTNAPFGTGIAVSHMRMLTGPPPFSVLGSWNSAPSIDCIAGSIESSAGSQRDK